MWKLHNVKIHKINEKYFSASQIIVVLFYATTFYFEIMTMTIAYLQIVKRYDMSIDMLILLLWSRFQYFNIAYIWIWLKMQHQNESIKRKASSYLFGAKDIVGTGCYMEWNWWLIKDKNEVGKAESNVDFVGAFCLIIRAAT